MIQEAYVSYEIAKLLKKKGFDVPCNSWYIPYSDGSIKTCMLAEPVDYNHYDGFPWTVSRPTHQMACAWLREKGYHIYAFMRKDNTWVYEIQKLNEDWTYSFGNFRNYEEAIEAALKYTLENLL